MHLTTSVTSSLGLSSLFLEMGPLGDFGKGFTQQKAFSDGCGSGVRLKLCSRSACMKNNEDTRLLEVK